MKLRTVLRWLFVYLPVRFSLPFLGLLAWFLFYIWPWLLDLAFPGEAAAGDIRAIVRSWVAQRIVPVWIETLNLTPAAKAAAVLAILLIGVLAVYNVAALWYQQIRRWSRQSVLIGTLLLNLFIYSYPWLFAPKDWASRTFFVLPFYLRRPWIDGFSEYGVLWLLPALLILASLSFELVDRRRIRLDSAPLRSNAAPAVENPSFEQLLKSRQLRIGLILSGGGAKGVYQAGAMKAIYEFLQHYDCLNNVKMLAGTSIGSWNSIFWLAGLIESHPGKPSVHELWWRTTNIARIVEFDVYLPLLKNSMLRPTPWRENFDEIFGASRLKSVLDDPNAVHFYLTRSNVAQGRLEFTTNWGKDERTRALQSEDIQVDSFTEPQSVNEIRDAVFASMDLPPLFPYQEMNGEYFEDGGVIDNLPIRFGTFVEECDLLFVLALNSSFETIPGQCSILQRLARVMDIRQGVLERNAMRMAYLYNNINRVSGGVPNAATKTKKVVRIFAICPGQPLLVNTAEFWKTDHFESAFRTMYEATRVELSRFDFMVEPAAQSDRRSDWLRMALVSAAGQITYNDRF